MSKPPSAHPDPRYWAGKTVAVTGGSGFLGYHLVRELVALGARVRTLGPTPSPEHPLLGLNIERVVGDVRDAAAVRTTLAGCEVVFHTAALVSVFGRGLEQMHSVHVEGTRQVLAAADTGARVVHTSSVVTIGAGSKGEVLTEDSPFNLDELRVDYVHSKRAAEVLALAAAQQRRDVVIVNPGYLVGPDDHEHSVMGRLFVRFWKGRLRLGAPGGLNLVDVRDVACGHLLAAERGQPGRRTILGGENVPFQALLQRLSAAAALRPRGLVTAPLWAMPTMARLEEWRGRWTGREPYPSRQQARMSRHNWFYSSERATTELGFRARPLDESLAETFAWHAARGAVRLRGVNRWWMRPVACT